ncbi:MAG: archaetidylserine decarboxylase [Gammaproteobacteria bacterium]|nr:archaetidylserine decarboxylase [Gammaproteobacteria bacterium]
MRAKLFVILQYLLPRYWLTSVIYRLARVRSPAVKNFMITRFIALYDVDVETVKLDVPGDFESFNDFFIRELEDDARPVDQNPAAIVSPVDGTVSAAGTIHGHSIFQAKGLEYSLDDLLATDLQEAHAYVDGSFATIYLAPYNYHRVHAPMDGRLIAARYVPGDLFSVNVATAANVPGLFRRNERLVLHFDTPNGPVVLIFVGALNVGSISTPWSGEVRPRKHGVVEAIELGEEPRDIRKGDLLGWFNMGSTVIVLFPRDTCTWNSQLVPEATVRMGDAIGLFTAR